MKGRILHFAWRYPPCYCSPTGSARNVALSEGLSDLDWDVTVVTSRPIDDPCPCWQMPDAGTPVVGAKVRVVFIDTRQWRMLRWYRASSSSSLRDRVLRKAVALAAVPFDTNTNFVHDGYSLGRDLAATWAPDVVMTSGRPIAAFPMVTRLGRKLGATSVIHMHDSVVRMARDRGHRWLRAGSLRRALTALRRADVVLGTSREEVDRDLAVVGREIIVLDGGFDEEFWRDMHESALQTPPEDVFSPDVVGSFRVVYTGRLYDFQDPVPLLQALKTLDDRLASTSPRPNLALCVFGPETRGWVEAARAVGAESLLHEFGMVDRHRASLALKHAHVGVVLGRKDRAPGNFGQKLFDYIASGVPTLYVPGDDLDSGSRALADAGAGTAAASADEALAYLAMLVERWDGSGRGAPGHVGMAASERGDWSMRRLAQRVDERLTEIVA